MNKKIIRAIIPLCIFILFISISLQEYNHKYNNTEVVEAMINNEEEISEENNDKSENKSKIDYSKTKWNLQSLYKSEDERNKELKKFTSDTKELKNYIGKVTKSKTHLSFALDIKEKLDIRLDKLYGYVKLNQDINKNSYKYIDMKENINRVYRDYSNICSSLELEILKLSAKEYNNFIKDKKLNKKYGMYLKDIRQSKEHYLDENSESLLANVSSISSLPGQVYELLKIWIK